MSQVPEHSGMGDSHPDVPVMPENDGAAVPSPVPAPSRRQHERRIVVATVAVALVAALAGGLVGGLVGGYIGFRSAQSATQPGFSLGTVSPGSKSRPAGSIAGLAARILPSVVMIRVDGNQGTGSGFIIQGGYIVTDNHVVTLDGQLRHVSLQVVFNGGATVPARLIGRDPYSDIAVIKPQGGGSLPAVILGNSSSVEVGDPVIAIGSPLGLAGTVTSGIVSALNRPVQPGAGDGSAPQVFYDAIQTDAPLNPGNSGGPLVNSQGQVIGVDSAIDTINANPLTGTAGGSIGLGFAIPINQAKLVATELIRTGHAVHAVIGALLSSSYPGTGAQIRTASLRGTPAITPGGPAARAGLRPGDVVVRFAGQPIVSAYALLDAIRSTPPGTRVAVTFIRNGTGRTVALTLGSAPS
jgi:S1-C subfamily serine protease